MYPPLPFAAARLAALPRVLAKPLAHGLTTAVVCLCLVACGADMVPSPYPAARATEPVGDDTGLQGAAVAGTSGGGTTVGPGTPSPGGGDTGGDPQNGNDVSLRVQLNLQAAGRAVLAHASGEGQWVADLQPQASHYRLLLWPRGDASQAAVRSAPSLPPAEAPALILTVPRGAPLGVQLDAAVQAAAADPLPTPGSWWGRARLDALPLSSNQGAAIGEFEVHGPPGTLAGRFHAAAGPPSAR